MAAKCNITSFALKKLNGLYWATKYDSSVDDAIAENYAESLNCSVMTICNDDTDCVNNPIVFTCSLAISGISSTITGNTVVFFIPDGGITNGQQPYSYTWGYNASDFDNSGVINQQQTTLTVKIGKQLSILVSRVTVNIVDNLGCKASKICYITPSGMQCASNYAACPNINSLIVNNKVSKCFSVNGLIVNKK